MCLWARERGQELVHGVSLKDETSEKRNFKQREGYSPTEGRTVRSTGQAWSGLSRILWEEKASYLFAGRGRLSHLEQGVQL